VFYFVLQSTALLRVSLGRCERLLREQRTVGITTGECLLRVRRRNPLPFRNVRFSAHCEQPASLGSVP
jgi:hypothetical protein